MIIWIFPSNDKCFSVPSILFMALGWSESRLHFKHLRWFNHTFHSVDIYISTVYKKGIVIVNKNVILSSLKWWTLITVLLLLLVGWWIYVYNRMEIYVHVYDILFLNLLFFDTCPHAADKNNNPHPVDDNFSYIICSILIHNWYMQPNHTFSSILSLFVYLSHFNYHLTLTTHFFAQTKFQINLLLYLFLHPLSKHPPLSRSHNTTQSHSNSFLNPHCSRPPPCSIHSKHLNWKRKKGPFGLLI